MTSPKGGERAWVSCSGEDGDCLGEPARSYTLGSRRPYAEKGTRGLRKKRVCIRKGGNAKMVFQPRRNTHVEKFIGGTKRQLDWLGSRGKEIKLKS